MGKTVVFLRIRHWAQADSCEIWRAGVGHKKVDELDSCEIWRAGVEHKKACELDSETWRADVGHKKAGERALGWENLLKHIKIFVEVEILRWEEI